MRLAYLAQADAQLGLKHGRYNAAALDLEIYGEIYAGLIDFADAWAAAAEAPPLDFAPLLLAAQGRERSASPEASSPRGHWGAVDMDELDAEPLACGAYMACEDGGALGVLGKRGAAGRISGGERAKAPRLLMRGDDVIAEE